mgnify:CR=1 FL=1
MESNCDISDNNVYSFMNLIEMDLSRHCPLGMSRTNSYNPSNTQDNHQADSQHQDQLRMIAFLLSESGQNNTQKSPNYAQIVQELQRVNQLLKEQSGISDDLVILERLGSGSYGEAHRILDLHNRKFYAQKIVHSDFLEGARIAVQISGINNKKLLVCQN